MYGKQRRSQSRLQIEQLEARAMLALTFAQDLDGTVTLTGTNAEEIVYIQQTNTNEWTVTEYSDALFGTEINSTILNADNGFGAVTGFDINLRSGNDQLLVEADYDNGTIELTGGISIATGRGADNVAVQGVAMDGDLTINNGANVTGEDEAITVGDVFVGGSLGINGGAGRDVVNVSFTTVSQSLLIAVGAGNDEVNALNTSVVDEAFVRLGLGDDLLTWKSDASIDLDVGGSLTIHGGGGNDDIDILGDNDNGGVVDIAGGLNLLLGSGNDGSASLPLTPVQIDYVNATGASTINGGTGDDVLAISNSYFEDLTLRMGAGDDVVTITNTDGSVLAIGGTGSDTLDIIGSPNLERVVRSFEEGEYEE